MLFCDCRSALTLDLRLMDSLWLRKDCNVGPMVELQAVIQEFIGPDSHQTSLDCFTEVFHIAKKPDAFIVRNGELIGIYIEEERITLRSVLENNRFVMELESSCLKGSLIDFAAAEDHLIVFNRASNRVYTFDLHRRSCIGICEIRGLPVNGEKHVVMKCCKGRVLFCFGYKSVIRLYDAELRGSTSFSQARRLLCRSTVNGKLQTMDISCRPSDTYLSVRIVFGDDFDYYALSLTLSGGDRPQIFKKNQRAVLERDHLRPDDGSVKLAGHDSVVVNDWKYDDKVVWKLLDVVDRRSMSLPIPSNAVVASAGCMPQGVLYVATLSSPGYKMLFCDRRTALTLDLRLMESLWLRKDCNVGPMVELQSVVQEFIGPDSHQTTLDCFTEVFHIAKKPDAFIVRHGELIGIYIEEERITLRSVLENNRFVMELDPPCPKGSFIDFSADEDRLTAFDRKANRLYLYDLGKGRCTSVVEIRGLPRAGEKRLVARYAENRFFVCFGFEEDLSMYDCEVRGGSWSSQARRLITYTAPNDRWETIDMSCFWSETCLAVNVIAGDEMDLYCYSFVLDESRRPRVLRKIWGGVLEHAIEPRDTASVHFVSHTCFIVRRRNDDDGVSWYLGDIDSGEPELIALSRESSVLASGCMPQGVMYAIEDDNEVPTACTIRLLHRYQ
ncbi:hypothetical protein FOZ61_004568 [Perkinsus olseni]|uniref:Uncharacterized protein n=1 Tax=Perkinsus olseni TaxID=32597 RepID=A0A7J6MCG5_PEROL|nr:hypothetical protein FOZ61_004568 [Perkinsus olseni]